MKQHWACPSILKPLASEGRGVQALVASDFCFHLGFYMLVPFLGSHLGRLGYGAASIGFVLGIRALGQHGLSLVGGYASDRFGPRPVIVAGCLLRALSFFALGIVQDFPLVLLALLASGAASALFRPASSAYLAAAVRGERTAVFATSTVLNEVGSFAGPLLGMLLLEGGFGQVCAASGVLFFAAGVVLGAFLPIRARVTITDSAHGIGHALRNSRLWAFSLAVSGYFVLFDQMYLLIPLEVARLTQADVWTGVLFAASSALVVAGQLNTTRLFEARSSPGAAVAIGLALMGAAFLLQLWPGADLPLLALGVAMLTWGTMVAYPFVRDIIPRLAREHALGACYGLFHTIVGAVATLGNTLVGALYDGDTPGTGFSPWLFLAALGLVSAAFVYSLERRGFLEPPTPSHVPQGNARLA
jgi:predicted MFS family arabinose efflux permease